MIEPLLLTATKISTFTGARIVVQLING